MDRHYQILLSLKLKEARSSNIMYNIAPYMLDCFSAISLVFCVYVDDTEELLS